MTIGERMKEKRKENKMTLEDVAKKSGVSRQTIQRYEAGIIQNIPSDRIEAIAEALGVSPAYLMGWEENVNTIAAHHDNEDWSEEELQEIENFKKYVLSKRK